MALSALIFLSVIFAAAHIGLSHGSIRKNLVEKLGKLGFMVVYSLVSLLSFGGALAILIFSEGPSLGPVLYALPGWIVYPATYFLMFVALFMIIFSGATPSPTGMMPAEMEPRGIVRITRHSMNMGFAALALAHIIAIGALGDIAFFSSIFVVGFFGAFHQDSRKAVERGEDFIGFKEKTSVIPFLAILRRKTSLKIGEFSLPILLVVLVVYIVLVMWGHEFLFKVAPH